MATTEKNIDSINVFLIGNNPIELSNIYMKLKEVHEKTFHTEVSFEFKGLFRKIMKFNPSCLLIDDNIERLYVNKLLTRLSRNLKTRDIPVTVIKNSNSDVRILQAEEYLLKETMTGDSLLRSIRNSMRIKKMQRRATNLYRKNKSRFLDRIFN